MPHILVDKFQTPPLNTLYKGVLFRRYCKNLEYSKEGLLEVECEGVAFLLQVKPKSGKYLIKAEKVSRPSPNTLIKRALKAYIELVSPKLFFENISNFKKSKLNKPSKVLKDVSSFDASFLPKKPIWLEVGFGSGRHLIYHAKKNRDIHFIGLEIHRPSIEQVIRRVELESLDNVWLVDYDARLFMELLPSNLLEIIFVHFPVPWDKKPHRRVISSSFIEESLRVLQPGGTLQLRTDSENYFRYSLELFTSLKKLKLNLFKNIDTVVRSKYEDRWVKLNKNIYEIHVESLFKSKQKKCSYDFSFNNGQKKIFDIFKNRPCKAIVKEDFFVHFERYYAANEKEGLIRVSFGSFDRPEHKYLTISNGEIDYFPYAPVKTETNYKAHKLIEELLNAECSRGKRA